MVTYEEIAEYAFMAFVMIAIIAGLAIGYMAWDSSDTARENYPAGLVKPPDGVMTDDVASATGYVTLIMLILGIIVGVISITAKEVTPFLISAIALMVARIGLGTAADVWVPLGELHMLLPYWATQILNYIVAFVAPAAVIIAIRSVWALARKK